MTRIDFYILPDSEAQARLRFVCRLVEKAYRQQRQVYVHCDDTRTSEALDELLWGARPDSFIPHDCQHRNEDTQAPVRLGQGEDPGEHHDVLINLSQDIPLFFSRFERCAEIVLQSPDALQASRRHFAFYRDRGYPLHNHDLRPKRAGS